MPHETTWLIPDRVIMAAVSEAVTADEVQIVADKLYEMMDAPTSNAAIHILVDVRAATMADKVWNYALLKLRRHKRIGWAIVIGDSRLGGLVIAIFSKLLNLHIHYSETPEAALTILRERDEVVAEFLKNGN